MSKHIMDILNETLNKVVADTPELQRKICELRGSIRSRAITMLTRSDPYMRQASNAIYAGLLYALNNPERDAAVLFDEHITKSNLPHAKRNGTYRSKWTRTEQHYFNIGFAASWRV